MNLTWLDNNSWLIEIAQQKILIDPWLIDDLTFNDLDWLFKASRSQNRSIPDNINLILLSQGLEDHAHLPTLKQLEKNIPVVASPNAAKVVEQLGYEQIITLKHGETFTLNHQVNIKAFPGSPIGPTLLENGYLLQDLANNSTLYYEPHGYHSPQIKEIKNINVIITPIINISLPIIGTIIKGMNSSLEIAKSVKPQFMLPTAAGGDIVFGGILAKLIQNQGTIAEFQTLLEKNNLTTKVITPHPDEKVVV
ncbi:MAG: MBL fold metallo-hydrolase [Cuspidothrix sp.]